ncbi:MAG: hypothetical protein H0T46_18410 [Deltaproteobacteria bacterium]|nr:hypothetical protein [Deltaproteobacteria bacterium]
MRALAIVLLLVPAIGHADSYVELGGGLNIPVSDDEYTRYVEPSPNLFVRIGGGGPRVGGMFSVDWTPLASDDGQFVDFNRFRILGHVVARGKAGPKVELAGRFGAGIDIMRLAVDATILGIRFEGSDTDLGFALEVGGGAWFTVGAGSTQVGVELVLPIAYHATEGNPNNPTDPDNARFEYTSVDLQILGGVRLRL